MDEEIVSKVVMGVLQQLKNNQHTLDLITSIGKKEILTGADLMALFNVSERTVQRWRKKGKLKALNVNGRYYYRWEDVVKFMEGR